MDETSASLLEQLRQPSAPESWRRFVRLYTPLLYQWARRLGLQDADAADLLQDVFTILHRSLPAFAYDPRRNFRAWLHTILLNCWRERRRRDQVRLLPTNRDDLDQFAADGDGPDLGEEEYRQQLVRRAIQVMQADFEASTWKACWQLIVDGRRAADVAAELGLTAAAVYAARSRVLRRLRNELRGLLD
jgi:RNA polymerase sigma-70 factor (ECF subfamily)